MGDVPTRSAVNAEAQQAIEAYRESANKNPELHLADLMRHAVGYMRNKNSYYLEHKKTYDDAMERHKNDPKNVKAPLPDPFVVSYEQADASIRKMIEGTTKKVEELAKLDEGGFKKLAAEIFARSIPADVKRLANTTWIRTTMPERQLVSNIVDRTTGVRNMIFAREAGETADSYLKIWPSGTIKVVENGVEKPAILPPFPDIFLTYQSA